MGLLPRLVSKIFGQATSSSHGEIASSKFAAAAYSELLQLATELESEVPDSVLADIGTLDKSSDGRLLVPPYNPIWEILRRAEPVAKLAELAGEWKQDDRLDALVKSVAMFKPMPSSRAVIDAADWEAAGKEAELENTLDEIGEFDV